MSRQTKLLLKIMAIFLFILTMGMHFGFIIIPILHSWKFWLLVLGFLLLLVSQ